MEPHLGVLHEPEYDKDEGPNRRMDGGEHTVTRDAPRQRDFWVVCPSYLGKSTCISPYLDILPYPAPNPPKDPVLERHL